MRPASARLIAALTRHIGEVQNVSVQSEPWRSATYTGARHMIWFDALAGARLESFRHSLGDIDLPISGSFVADIELIDRTVHATHERLGIAALTIEDA